MGFSKYLPKQEANMGISRDKRHKRRATGGRRPNICKKRKFELGRPPSNTKLGPQRIHTVRTMGGNKKYRALRQDHGNFAWGSEAITRKTRVIDVVYNASNNEAVRTKTLVKSCIVQIDSTPFRQWYEAHYAMPLGRKKGQKKFDERKKSGKVEQALDDQFSAGRVYAKISSRPGQCGRVDGYILEGRELDFYTRKMKSKKSK